MTCPLHRSDPKGADLCDACALATGREIDKQMSRKTDQRKASTKPLPPEEVVFRGFMEDK